MDKSKGSSTRLPLLLLVVFLTFGCARFQKGQPEKTHGAQDVSTRLSLEDVLHWRDKYADLLGKSKDAVVERYGKPTSEEPLSSGIDETMMWYEPSSKTEWRPLYVCLNNPLNQVTHVKIEAKDTDELDVLEVIRNGLLFDFGSGTFQDSAKSYFLAKTKDGRNAIQFDITSPRLKLAAVTFNDKN